MKTKNILDMLAQDEIAIVLKEKWTRVSAEYAIRHRLVKMPDGYVVLTDRSFVKEAEANRVFEDLIR